MKDTYHRKAHCPYAALLLAALLLAACAGVEIPTGLQGLRGSPASAYIQDFVIYNISGTVQDEQGQPLPGIQVFLAGKFLNTETATFGKTDWPLDTVQTERDGRFQSSKRETLCPYLQAIAVDPANQYRPDTLVYHLAGNSAVLQIELPSFSLKKK